MMAQSLFSRKAVRFTCLILLLLWGSHACYHHKAAGFSVKKILSDFSNRHEWEIGQQESFLKEKGNDFFASPFYYLGSGSQSYAFVSQDGKIVLKFFRMKHRMFYLRDLFNGSKAKERRARLCAVLSAHHLAYQEMKEDAGLLYLHLNKTHHLKRKITVIDKLHRTHVVDLDQVAFALQERAELIFSHLQNLLKQKKETAFQEAKSEVMKLIERRMHKGLSDHDKAVSHNFGFVGDRPIQIDVGRIHRMEEKRKKIPDSERVLQRIDRWALEQQS